MSNNLGTDPGVVIIFGLAEAGQLQPGIIGLAMIQFGHEDRPLGCLPVLIRNHQFLFPIFIGKMKLQE
ncbi:hypothetical protein D3C75_1274730 [compost metagenome]